MNLSAARNVLFKRNSSKDKVQEEGNKSFMFVDKFKRSVPMESGDTITMSLKLDSNDSCVVDGCMFIPFGSNLVSSLSNKDKDIRDGLSSFTTSSK